MPDKVSSACARKLAESVESNYALARRSSPTLVLRDFLSLGAPIQTVLGLLEIGMQMRRRGGRKRAIGTRAPIAVHLRPNERWSLDFASGQMTDDRRFRILAMVDDCTGECLAVVPNTQPDL